MNDSLHFLVKERDQHQHLHNLNCLKGLMCVFMIFWGFPAAAFSLPDVLNDPLLTLPPTIYKGANLPNSDTIVCPPRESISHALTLNEVVDFALCNNPQIKQAWANIKVQAGALGEAKSTYLPTATATYSPLQQTSINYDQSPENSSQTQGQQAYINLTWRILDFGGRAANRRSANYLLESALANHDASLQKILASTIQAYFDVLTSKATVRAKEQANQFAKVSWEATVRREKKGVSAKSDSLQALTALLKAQLASSRALGDYRKAQAALVIAMGFTPQTIIELEELNESPHEQDFKDLNTWLNDAQIYHPAIKAAKAQLESAKEKIVAAKSLGLPSLDFVGNYYQNGYPNQGVQQNSSNTTIIGLTINVPIFEGFATTYKIRGQQAQVEKAQAVVEDTANQVYVEIVKSHADAISSLGNLESSQQLLEAATAAVESSVKRYEKGAADVLELLTTQTSLSEAQQERIRCISEYRSARLRLMANAGVLSKVDSPAK